MLILERRFEEVRQNLEEEIYSVFLNSYGYFMDFIADSCSFFMPRSTFTPQVDEFDEKMAVIVRWMLVVGKKLNAESLNETIETIIKMVILKLMPVERVFRRFYEKSSIFVESPTVPEYYDCITEIWRLITR